MPKDTTTDLHTELKNLADTLEEVLSDSANKSKTELEKLRTKAQQTLSDARERLSHSGERLVQQTREAAGRADEYVHDNPWTGVGIGAAVGVVLGVLLARR
ncbi:YqjD family protein [Enterobacteriaceae bacterium LUAb1]